MTRHLTLGVLGLLLTATTGCGSAPTAPRASASLALSTQSATIARNTSMQVTASMSGTDGATQDVTGIATWSSSNPVVATVTAGQITVVGLGTAQITAAYQQHTATMTVVGRRRTLLQGSLAFRDAAGETSLQSFGLYIDDKYLGGVGGWGTPIRAVAGGPGIDAAGFDIEFGGDGIPVEPGPHQIAVEIRLRPGPHEIIALGSTFSRPGLTLVACYFKVVDGDTDTGLPSAPAKYRREVLLSDSLPEQRATLTDGQRFSWTIQVPSYTQ